MPTTTPMKASSVSLKMSRLRRERSFGSRLLRESRRRPNLPTAAFNRDASQEFPPPSQSAARSRSMSMRWLTTRNIASLLPAMDTSAT